MTEPSEENVPKAAGGRSCLMLLDVLNDYAHDDSKRLAKNALEAVPQIKWLLSQAREAGVPIVYVNDNHEDWTVTREALISRAVGGRRPDAVAPLVPRPEDDFIFKLRHSGFFGTALEHYLRDREVERVVIAGQVTEQCVLYTAIDAYMREFSVVVPPDAVAHIDAEQARAALEMVASNLGGECGMAASVSF